MCKYKKNNGWLMTETAVVLFLTAVFSIALISAMATFRKLNYNLLKKQQCLAAGRAQLESVIATGQTIDDEDFKRLWPDVEVAVDRQGGQGDWTGLDLCIVTTKARVRKRYVEIQLCRYYLPSREE